MKDRALITALKTPDGITILNYLSEKYGDTFKEFVPGDANATAYNIGKRSVFQDLKGISQRELNDSNETVKQYYKV